MPVVYLSVGIRRLANDAGVPSYAHPRLHLIFNIEIHIIVEAKQAMDEIWRG